MEAKRSFGDAIVAEAIWGVDDVLYVYALSLLPEDLRNVVTKFRDQINR